MARRSFTERGPPPFPEGAAAGQQRPQHPFDRRQVLRRHGVPKSVREENESLTRRRTTEDEVLETNAEGTADGDQLFQPDRRPFFEAGQAIRGDARALAELTLLPAARLPHLSNSSSSKAYILSGEGLILRGRYLSRGGHDAAGYAAPSWLSSGIGEF
jgi:hypothetical protein